MKGIFKRLLDRELSGLYRFRGRLLGKNLSKDGTVIIDPDSYYLGNLARDRNKRDTMLTICEIYFLAPEDIRNENEYIAIDITGIIRRNMLLFSENWNITMTGNKKIVRQRVMREGFTSN